MFKVQLKFMGKLMEEEVRLQKKYFQTFNEIIYFDMIAEMDPDVKISRG